MKKHKKEKTYVRFRGHGGVVWTNGGWGDVSMCSVRVRRGGSTSFKIPAVSSEVSKSHLLKVHGLTGQVFGQSRAASNSMSEEGEGEKGGRGKGDQNQK